MAKENICPKCGKEYEVADWEWIPAENKINLWAYCECGAYIDVTYNVTLADITVE